MRAFIERKALRENRPLTPGHERPGKIAVCPLRERCTTSSHGRSIHIHPDERLLQELHQRQETKGGRAQLRERVKVEHGFSHIGHWQGPRARYLGKRKNLFDLRRFAMVHNLHCLDRIAQQAMQVFPAHGMSVCSPCPLSVL